MGFFSKKKEQDNVVNIDRCLFCNRSTKNGVIIVQAKFFGKDNVLRYSRQDYPTEMPGVTDQVPIAALCESEKCTEKYEEMIGLHRNTDPKL